MLFINAILALASALTVLSAPGDSIGTTSQKCSGENYRPLIDSECQPYDSDTGINATVPISCNFYATINCTDVVLQDDCATVAELVPQGEMYFKCVADGS
ncbi:hypothetical protein MGYG_02375 [Nannizzia gypsea CBS 118893]|uniref:Uncharacterized protein n=1 Tax=Arthroderma gypseum (strain ATCC MYA-4604 / CBS 118893) TaxID=535722 RepID=E4UR88_ARTGP|nr:hypothetical protein MGYG_02375 [Nannizzia gypsea CBS 118893]EFQ99363.1 hypothetical protein MGYG_02375 [Nannizzia gypsea CBS 118893]